MTITTRIDTSTNSDLLKRGTLREVFDNTLKSVPEFWREMYNAKTTDLKIEKTQRMGSFVPATEHVEGQNIALQEPEIGQQKSYTQQYFGTGFRITFAMDKYNQYDLYRKWTRGIAKAQKEAKDIEVHKPFNSPTATYVGYDTFAMGYASHTILPSTSSTTYSNYGNASLSQTAIETARYYFKTLINDAGQYMGAIPEALVIESTLYPIARELLGSDHKAYMAGDTVNVVGEMGMRIVENPRISSASRWFIRAKKDEDYDFNVYTSLEPIFFEKDAPDQTLDKLYLTEQHFTFGFGDPRMIYVGY